MEKRNLFNFLSIEVGSERFENLLETNAIILERIISRASSSPAGEWYDQERSEWVVLLKGSAGLRIEGDQDILELMPGDYVFLPAHLRHRVEWTDANVETVWLALHYRD